MNPTLVSPVPALRDELSDLISVLLATEERLDELTGGEVDSVTDSAGRSVLLRRPQEQLRHAELGKQAAILNALPAQVAMLDTRGVIVSVNQAWRDFADANGWRVPGHGVGSQYLAVCDVARGTDAEEAGTVGDGIRAVLCGDQARFSIEYPCHSPTVERWFLLTVAALAGSPPNGAVAMHLDISERRQGEEALRRFRAAMDQTADAIYLIDRTTLRCVDVNATACRMLGYTREELLALDPEIVVGGPRSELEAVFDSVIAGDASGLVDTLQFRRKDGTRFVAEVRREAHRFGANWIIVGVVRDITERMRSEVELREAAGSLQQSRDRLSLATHAARIGIWDWNLRTDELIWDRHMREIYGVREQDFSGAYDAWRAGLHPQDRARAEAEIVNAVAGSGDFESEFRILLPSGEMREIKAFGAVRRAEDGTPVHMIGVNLDITERKRSEQRVERLGRVHELRSLVNSLVTRVEGRGELFREACRIAVEQGGFRCAMVVLLDDVDGPIRPEAVWSSDNALLANVEGLLASADHAMSTRIEQAIKQRRPAVIKDPDHDEQDLLRCNSTSAEVRSLGVLPLVLDGHPLGALLLCTPISDFFHGDELELLAALALDIGIAADHIEKAARLRFLAHYDELTGLANRTLFLDRTAHFVREAAQRNETLPLVLIDIERFKYINDSLGRRVGDDLLRQMADWLLRECEGAGRLARVDADRFALVLPGVARDGEVLPSLERIIEDLLAHKFELNGSEIRISAKFGIACFPDDGTEAETLFKHAEAALKKAKAGGDRYLFYTQQMTQAVARKLTLETQLKQAIDNDEYVLHYQPKVSLQTGLLTGCEALIRWNDPRTGLVPPGVFIPVLEETGLIYEVGKWALGQALADYLRWRDAGLAPVRIAVNVSPLQLRHPGFVAEIRRIAGLDVDAASGLELEITESMIMSDVKQGTASLQAIRELGLTIAIDDFGTGYSSLGYLSKLPVTTLKIDRTFVVDMTESPEGLSLVSTMIHLAHSLRLKVVAEGVETEAQSNLLRLLKCEEMQGFLFSRPVPGADFEARFLARQASVPA
jgi:diguanylate cyclase (GGDEF)-like protein/PAS domain S-box-containing protein